MDNVKMMLQPVHDTNNEAGNNYYWNFYFWPYCNRPMFWVTAAYERPPKLNRWILLKH